MTELPDAPPGKCWVRIRHIADFIVVFECNILIPIDQPFEETKKAIYTFINGLK